MTSCKYSIGDFVTTDKSREPAVIINIDSDRALISIHEYFGDYIFVDICDITPCDDIDNYKQLSILAGFGEWFYRQHLDIYQELIINTLSHRLQ